MSRGYNDRLLAGVYLAADAAAFAACVFLCARAALLRLEDAATMMQTLNVLMAAVAFLFVSRCAAAKLFGGGFFAGFALELAFLFAAAVVPMRLAMSHSGAVPFYRLPYLASRFPADLLMFVRDAVLPAAAFLAVFLIAVRLASRLRAPRMFVRAFMAAIVALFAALNFSGAFPAAGGKEFSKKPGVVRMLPPRETKGGDAALRPPQINDVQPCPTLNCVWLAYEKKLLKLDNNLKSSGYYDLAGVSPDRLAADPLRPVIYALDAKGEKAVVSGENGSGQAGVFPVKTDWGGEARAILPYGNAFYVLYDGQPGVAEFDAESGLRTGAVRFLEPRSIAFRTGGWALAVHAPSDSLYALAGPADASGKAALVRIEPERFRIVSMGVLPDAGPALALNPAKPVAYMTSFNRDNIYEIDLASLKAVRVLPGPAGARALALDTRRNILFAAGYYSGRFMATDLKTGRVLRSGAAGARASALKLDRAGKYLYVVSSRGAFRVDIDSYLGSSDKRLNAGVK
ncbi:MAG: hypothetical protein WCX65_02200 [bacterium]